MNRIFIFLATILLLTGCSLFNEVSDSVNYVDEATNYIQNLTDFGNEAPQLIQSAATNNIAYDELLSQLNSLKTEVTNFITIDPPQLAVDVHQQLVTSGEKILDTINSAVQDGELMLNQLTNSEILQTINNVSNLMNQVENLGFKKKEVS
jgi:PBP1b-binding outer membrane lipoprotein LpoB